MTNIPAWSLVIAALGTLGVRQLITWLLNRGKVKVDEATAIRMELRAEIVRKDAVIATHESRISRMEQSHEAREDEFNKKEAEFNQALLKFRMYKVEMYKTLIENGTPANVLEQVRLIDF